MKIEKRVILTKEELAIINRAYGILSDYVAECVRVDDSQIGLKDKAQDACACVDDFLCEYAEVYE